MDSQQRQSPAGPFVAGGQGCHFWDHDGRRYLDFASPAVNVNLGYGHPRVVRAIAEQAARLRTVGPAMASEPRSELGRLLADVAVSR